MAGLSLTVFGKAQPLLVYLSIFRSASLSRSGPVSHSVKKSDCFFRSLVLYKGVGSNIDIGFS